MYTVRLAIGDLQVARPGCPRAHNDRVTFGAKLRHVEIDTNIGIGYESLERKVSLGPFKLFLTYHTLRRHEIQPALDDGLVKFHAAIGTQGGIPSNLCETYFGMPYIKRPPMRSLRSYTVTK